MDPEHIINWRKDGNSEKEGKLEAKVSSHYSPLSRWLCLCFLKKKKTRNIFFMNHSHLQTSPLKNKQKFLVHGSKFTFFDEFRQAGERNIFPNWPPGSALPLPGSLS